MGGNGHEGGTQRVSLDIFGGQVGGSMSGLQIAIYASFLEAGVVVVVVVVVGGCSVWCA